MSETKHPKTIKIPGDQLGPRSATVGSKMYVDWPGYRETFVWTGKCWKLESTHKLGVGYGS